MRVAMIAPGYAPALGGVETHVTRVCEELVRLGVEVEVWAQDGTVARPTFETRCGVRVRRFPRTGTARYPVSVPLWRHVRRHVADVDLVHAQSYHVTAALSGLLTPAGTPLVVTPHYHGTGHTPLATLLHRPYRVAGRRLLERADAVLAVPAAERELLVRDFPAVAERCRVVHNGVDADRILAAEPFPDQPPTLLALGRLEPYKRLDVALKAFGRCRRPGQFVVLGSGPDVDRLRALRDRSPRAADIRLEGRVSDEDTARWLRTARGVVSLSAHEAFGLAALEGLTAGAQAVLSDIPAHREVAALAAGRASWLVPPSEPARVTWALDRVLASPPSPARAIRSWRQAAEEHAQIYRACARRVTLLGGPLAAR